DMYIVNTCSVTAESHRQSGQLVRRCAHAGPTAVLGCASQKDASAFAAIPNVFYVGGCRDKGSVVGAVIDFAARNGLSEGSGALCEVCPMEGAPYEPLSVSGRETNPLFSSCRAFVKIQDGCSSRCSYCVIPSLRGPTRSRPAEDILEEADRLADAGYREIILTGISVSSFASGGFRLPDLIRAMGEKAERGIRWVRLGSVSPGSVNDAFLRAASESPNFMPHLHLSLQSGSDRILRAMNRPYTAEQAMEKVRMLRDAIPEIELSADFITGFPTETEEDFGRTVGFAKEAKLLHIHAFPYSEREGTPAAVMEGSVPKPVRRERCARLNLVSGELRRERMSRKIGGTVEVLVEKTGRGFASGHTKEYMECRVRTGDAAVGDLLTCEVRSLDGDCLTGENAHAE
ncbi:MAG: MiaB/RimO family radical SAM methylthiotransferase, partial [Clostridia bacterium]|nr:MiaB/RimO family radical SAM methylthiotransferase [Clostridia bacterium]